MHREVLFHNDPFFSKVHGNHSVPKRDDAKKSTETVGGEYIYGEEDDARKQIALAQKLQLGENEALARKSQTAE